MQTVVPANSTARPEVLIAGTIESSTRHAAPKVAAVPGDDEQRVVDADTDHHQLGELRRDVRDVHHMAQHPNESEARGERRRRARQRQGGGADRAEHERQDDQGREEAEEYRRDPAAGVLVLTLERVTRELDLQRVAAQLSSRWS